MTSCALQGEWQQSFRHNRLRDLVATSLRHHQHWSRLYAVERTCAQAVQGKELPQPTE
jgi:hypothetical protein